MENKNFKEIMENIYDFVEGSEEENKRISPQDNQYLLAEAGIDIDKFVDSIAKDIGKTKAKEKLKTANKERIKLTQEFGDNLISISEEFKNVLLKYFESLNQTQKQAFAHYRNLENISEGDINSFFNDLKILYEKDKAHREIPGA